MIGLALLPPPWWPLLLLLPVVIVLGARRLRRRAARCRELLGHGDRETPFGWRLLRWTWWPLGAVALGVAMLQPVAGSEHGEPAGPDVVFCLDVSWSMAAQDVPPARLQRATADLQALGEQVRGARFGLVVFAGEARLSVPLTADVGAVAVMAANMAPGAELQGGTDLGAAIDVAARAIARSGSEAGSIVLLTDGEDFGGAGRRAAQRAQQAGLVVHCVGYGTEIGSKIAVESDEGQQFLRDASGEAVISVLDRQALTAVATNGGGVYADGAEREVLTQLQRDVLQPRAEAAALQRGERQVAHRYQWPLLLALLLWMLRLCMPERIR